MCWLVQSVLTYLTVIDIYKLLPSIYRSVNVGWQCQSIAFVSFWYPFAVLYGDLMWLIIMVATIIRYAHQAILLVETKHLFKGHRARFKVRDHHADTYAPGRNRFICAVILWQVVLMGECGNALASRSPNAHRKHKRQSWCAIQQQRSAQQQASRLVSSKRIDQPDAVQRRSSRIIDAAVAYQVANHPEKGI
jgi:hypothetical protein